MSDLSGTMAMGLFSSPRGKLRQEIAKLEERAETAGLSISNTRMLKMFKLELEFQGQDQWVVIAAQGAITLPGDGPAVGRIVCVKAQRAADLIAFADVSGHRVRLATQAEIDAQMAYERAVAEAAQQTIANTQARIARQQIMALLGGPIPGGAFDSAPVAQPLAPPIAEIEVDRHGSLEANVPAMPAPVRSELGTDAAHMAAVSSAQPHLPTFDPELAVIGKPQSIALLVEAGFRDVDSIASAAPADLTKVRGISAAEAAKLIAGASEAVARRPKSRG